MNNSQIAKDNTEEVKDERLTLLREREAQLVRIIDAINGVAQSLDWKTLVKEIFNDVTATLEHRVSVVAKAKKIDEPELYRLQGQLGWAKKFSNLEELGKALKVELSNVKQQINGK